MPGVVINTAVRTGPNTPSTVEAAQAFFVGIADRGPTAAATLVKNIEEFALLYGPYSSSAYLQPTVETFFEEGGTQCYVARVTGTSAASSTLNIENATPATAIIITANGHGVWGDDLAVTVTAGTLSGTINISFTYNGTKIGNTGNCATNLIAIGKINSDATLSKYVIASSGVGVDTIAAAVEATSLASGAAGSTPSNAQLVTGLALFSDSFGTGAVACPESSHADVYTGLVDHANDFNRIAILHGGSSDSIATTKTLGQTMSALDDAEHAALYYPWVYVPSAVAGVNNLTPPDGYVAAKRSAVVNTTGTHQPYAGLPSVAQWVNGVVTDVSKANGDLLDDERVNAIRVIANTVRIYGARSLSTDDSNYRFITSQDTVNDVVTQGYRTLEDILFHTIDGRNHSFANIEARLIAVLEGFRIKGALYEAFNTNGVRLDYGYTVKCDNSLNPVAQLATGLVKARIGVRVSSIGDKIEVNIIKSNLTTSVV